MTTLSPTSANLPDEAGLFARLQALDHGAEPSAELQLLHWVMSLPAGLDPAAAAKSVLAYLSASGQHKLSPPLLRLLETVAQFPAQRLAALAGRRRHRIRN